MYKCVFHECAWLTLSWVWSGVTGHRMPVHSSRKWWSWWFWHLCSFSWPHGTRPTGTDLHSVSHQEQDWELDLAIEKEKEREGCRQERWTCATDIQIIYKINDMSALTWKWTDIWIKTSHSLFVYQNTNRNVLKCFKSIKIIKHNPINIYVRQLDKKTCSNCIY